MKCKHRYEPYDIGHRVEALKNYYYWRCVRCGNAIFSTLKEPT